MPLKNRWRGHRCLTIKEVDIDSWRAVRLTVLAALWWRVTNTFMDITEILIKRWIP